MYVMKLINHLTQEVIEIPIEDYDGVSDYSWLAEDLAVANGFGRAYSFTMEQQNG
jgi:hypothetical protein